MTDTMQETHGPTPTRILNTARQLFMQRGYRGVSITDIVQAAEITKPTLYYHFADKEELFVQMVLHMLHDMRLEVEQILRQSPGTVERLVALVAMIQQTPNLDSRMMRQEAREHLHAEQQQRISAAFYQSMFTPIYQVMVDGIERGELQGQDANRLAMLFLYVMEGFHFQSDAQRKPEIPVQGPFGSIHFTPETIVAFFLHGVGGLPSEQPDA